MKTSFHTANRFIFTANAAALGVLIALNIHASAATGTLLNTLSISVTNMVADPSRPLIYALEPGSNSVAVINTNTLSLVTTIPIGSNPTGLALSPDDSTLYVADNSASKTIGVLNLATLTTQTSISTPYAPYDVAVGNGNRLYASSLSNGIMQFNTTNGAYQTIFPGYPAYISTGVLAISPDRNTLYNETVGTSPITMQQYNVSTGTASLVQTQNFSQGGSVHPIVSGNGQYVITDNGYNIDKLSTGNITSDLGAFNVGAYPGGGVFSPDSSLLYAIEYGSNAVHVFNVSSTAQTATFGIGEQPVAVTVDNSGKYLFVAESNHLQIFSTGVPEPGTTLFLLVGFGFFGNRRHRWGN